MARPSALAALSALTPAELGIAPGEQIEWDRRLPGFGIRRQPSGRSTYIVFTRARDTVGRITLGSTELLGLR